MTTLQQYQEETLKKFDELVEYYRDTDPDFLYGVFPHVVEKFRELYVSSLKGQLVVVVELIENTDNDVFGNYEEFARQGFNRCKKRLTTQLLEDNNK